MDKPLVSIIIPTYNDSEYLAESINSALAQTYENIEIIVINDGSTRSQDDYFFSQFGKTYNNPKINLIFKENQGLAKARNTGIEASKGEFFLPLDADDKIDPTMVEKTLAEIQKNEKLGVVYTDQKFFGEEDRLMPMKDFDLIEELVQNHVSVCSLIRKKVWEDVKAKNQFGYNPNMKFGYEDWDFWISVSETNWDFQCLHQPLFHYRKRKNSMSKETLTKNDELFSQIVENHPELYKNNHQILLKRLQSLYREKLAYSIQLESETHDLGWLIKRTTKELTKL